MKENVLIYSCEVFVMDNLNILLKYLVNSDDVSNIANKAGVETSVVEKTCVCIYDYLIPSDFTRREGSHLEKKDLNKITSNFNKLLGGNDLKKIISDVALDQAEEQSRVAVVVKEVLVNIRGRLQYMTAVKKKPVEEVKPVKEEVRVAKPVKTKVEETVVEHKTLAKAIEEDVAEETIQSDIARSLKETAKNEEINQRKVEPKKERLQPQDGFEPQDDEEQLSKGEKIAIGVVGALLVVVIIVIIVILFKVIK